MNEIEKKAKKLALKLDEIWARQMDTVNRDDPDNYDKQVREAILQFAKEVAQKQRNRDRAVYSINRTKTSIEIKDAILKIPLVTETNTEK